MRTYNRNVRRAWDGEDYHAPKRVKLDEPRRVSRPPTNENYYLDTEDNLQRAIRETSVAAMSSSPSRKNSTICSYETAEVHEPVTLTPPSSPPPMLEITPPVNKQRKPTFSAIEKKKQRERLKSAKRKRDDEHMAARDGSEPLSEIMNSSSRTSAPVATSGFQPVQAVVRSTSAQQKNLSQAVLDFGQSNTPLTCGSCQMTYTPSVAEDVRLHDMYHNRHKAGIELDKPFMKSAMKWCYEVPNIPGSVVVVDRKISLPARRTVQKVLEVVNKELGSVEIPEDELWGQKVLDGEAEDSKKVDCYKVFLHVIDAKCVAVCLAERISKAYKVTSMNVPLDEISNTRNKNGDGGADSNREDSALLTPTSSSAAQSHGPSSADLQLDLESSDVVVGVSRIWTSEAFRKKGIANNLLDCVSTQFIYGLDIDKEEVAFSQPTDMGAVLARSWFGSRTGWCVYRET